MSARYSNSYSFRLQATPSAALVWHRDDERRRPKSTRPYEEESIRSRSVKAPTLSSGSFRLPHFGDWTHEGQPRSHGQPASIFRVSSTQPSKASKPRSVMPTPPEWP